MPSYYIRHRRAAFIEQDRCCYYCERRMWWSSPGELGPRLDLNLKCTAEHLHARCDGGSNSRANIVAACLRCNAGRHAVPQPLDAHSYRTQVRRTMVGQTSGGATG
jgi:hypothetical protein